MEYTWKINSLKVKDEGSNKSAVVQIEWQKIGVDLNENIGSFKGRTKITSIDLPNSEFIPITQLTEEIVVGWVQSKISTIDEEYINAYIQKEINAIINPILDIDLPWSTEELI